MRKLMRWAACGAAMAMLAVAPVRALGGFGVTNVLIGDGNHPFAQWAALPGVTALVGDFNGDGNADLALIGPPTWGSLPAAFSLGDGNFLPTQVPILDFAGWTGGASLLAGDFNGDGKMDVALYGVSTWQSLPVAFSLSVARLP